MNVRLLPFTVADGPTQMSVDEALLETADAGIASLRFYAWSPPTLSLGYFQSAADRFADVAWVRRPSGGGAIMHHHEVTYCLALPAGPPWQTGTSWLVRMHQIIANTLAEFGVAATPFVPPAGAPPFDGFLCFKHFTAGDLMIDGFKVVGSAQRRLRKAVMQHGSILLATSPHAAVLPGIKELSGRALDPVELCSSLAATFARQTGWSPTPGGLTDTERQRIEELTRAKYTQDSWNAKR